MAENAEQLLKAMAEKNKAEGEASVVSDDFYYPRIQVNKNKRTSMMVGFCFFLVIFTFILFANISLSQSWTVVVGPILLCASAIVLIPLSEEWIYRPWQINPQKYERHFTD